MLRKLKMFFLFSLLFYLVSSAVTRISDYGEFLDPPSAFLLGVWPFDWFPPLERPNGDVPIQMGVLSSSQVAELLKENPDRFPKCHEGERLRIKKEEGDYLVIRYKNMGNPGWGDLKCYFSHFPFPISQFVSMPYQMEKYYQVILPYPALSEDEKGKSSTVYVRWKKFWGD